MSHPDAQPFLRFVFTGAVNTLLTGALLLVIAGWIDVDVAYTIVYVLGLAFTTVVSARYVFRTELRSGNALRFVAWYLCVYLIGLSIVRIATTQWHASHLLATCCVLAITVPLNFLGGRRVFREATAPPRP
jgi:putative flippase GtrA